MDENEEIIKFNKNDYDKVIENKHVAILCKTFE